MSDHYTKGNSDQPVPPDIPLLHGPLTSAERLSQEQEEARKAKEQADRAFQERQVTAVEAANRIAARNTTLTGIAAIISLGVLVASFFQYRMSHKSWQTAQDTLQQIRTDSVTSGQQFQVQLRHFDDGLGRTGLLAQHAGEQAAAAKSLAGTMAKQFASDEQLLESQRASIKVSFGHVTQPITSIEGNTSLGFSILLQDTGAIKATHVTVRFKPYFSLWGQNIFTEPIQKQREFCAKPAPRVLDYDMYQIEPHTTLEHVLNFGMGKPGMGQIIKWPPPDAEDPKPAVTDRIFPFVVGCVDYQSGVMPEKHQTGFVFEVQQSSVASPGMPTLVHFDMNVPREKVIITQYYFGQGQQY